MWGFLPGWFCVSFWGGLIIKILISIFNWWKFLKTVSLYTPVQFFPCILLTVEILEIEWRSSVRLGWQNLWHYSNIFQLQMCVCCHCYFNLCESPIVNVFQIPMGVCGDCWGRLWWARGEGQETVATAVFHTTHRTPGQAAQFSGNTHCFVYLTCTSVWLCYSQVIRCVNSVGYFTICGCFLLCLDIKLNTVSKMDICDCINSSKICKWWYTTKLYSLIQ